MPYSNNLMGVYSAWRVEMEVAIIQNSNCEQLVAFISILFLEGTLVHL